MISRSFKHYLQFSLLVGYIGFAYAQDPINREYNDYMQTLKENILPKLEFVYETNKAIHEKLEKRFSTVENKIAQELGKESRDAFFKRTAKLYDEYDNALEAKYRHPDNKKIVEKAQKLAANPEIKKREKLRTLNTAKHKIQDDIDIQQRVLDGLKERHDNPDLYIAVMTKKVLSEDLHPRQKDRMPEFLDDIEFYKENEKGNDPMSEWFSEEYGYHGRPTAHILTTVVKDLDNAVGDYLVNTEHALRSNFEIPRRETVLEHLKLDVDTKNKSGSPMYSPLEPALSQRVAAYVAPRMQQVGSWWNRFTSNWFAKTPNRFAVMKSVRMPKLQQPRIMGPKIDNIDLYEQRKSSAVLSPYGK